MAERVTSKKDPNDPKDDTSNRTIKVLVIEASQIPTEKIRYTADLPAINTRDQPKPLQPDVFSVDAKYYLPNQPRFGILPDVRYDADTGHGSWTDLAWKYRAICKLGDYHILHTLATDEWMHPMNRSLFENWFLPKIFYGDIYILKASGKSYDGSTIYGDTLPDATPKDEEALINQLGSILSWNLYQGLVRERNRQPLQHSGHRTSSDKPYKEEKQST